MFERWFPKRPKGSPVTAVTARMRQDWDRRAREDHKLHIATGHAGSEEAFRASGRHDVEEVILDGLWLSPEASVLEIGCGVGRLLVPIAERVARAHGIDIAPTMIEKARAFAEGRPNVTFEVTDGTLGVPASSLDFVFSFIVFQHIPDKAPIAAYVREAARALSPGGVFRFQVDGRWRARGARTADTYDGVVFDPVEIRALVAGAGLTVVEECGADTHYHRLTCAKPGGNPRVRLFETEWDVAFLEALLADAGAPRERASDVAAGKTSLREALLGLEERHAALSNADFLTAMFRLLLRRAPDAGGAAFHTGILDGGFEDRSSLVETILMGSEFRGLSRPPSEPTWVVRESLARLGEPARRETLRPLADRLLASLEDVPAGRFVETAFEAALARRPDPDDTFDYGRVLSSEEAAARRALVLRLLGRGALPPAPPPRERIEALLARSGAAGSHALRRGESFPGEADVARAVLERAWDLSARDFVVRAYEKVLGRAADHAGASYYAGRVERGELSRPELVRELLWSEELRR